MSASRYRSVQGLVLALFVAASSVRAADVVKLTVPRTKDGCVAAGGDWILAGPQMVVWYCALKTSDGGKVCVTSRECQGECVETARGNMCASEASGCFRPTGRGTVTQCVN